MKTRYAEVPAYDTKDGSSIRELIHPAQHGPGAQSLAEARVAPGACTRLHRHWRSEEIYHVTAGAGRMRLGNAMFEIRPGDSIRIRPGSAHRLENPGPAPLVVLCCCAPPYAHEDTELIGAEGST